MVGVTSQHCQSKAGLPYNNQTRQACKPIIRVCFPYFKSQRSISNIRSKNLRQYSKRPKEGEFLIDLEEKYDSDDILLDFKLNQISEEQMDKNIEQASKTFSIGDTQSLINVPIDHEIVDEIRNFVKQNGSYLENDPRIEQEAKEILDVLLQMAENDDDPELKEEIALDIGTTLQELAKNYFIQRMPYDVLDKIGETSAEYDKEMFQSKETARGRAYRQQDEEKKQRTSSIHQGEDLENEWEAGTKGYDDDSEIQYETQFVTEPEPTREVEVEYVARDLQPTFAQEDIDYEVVDFVNTMVDRAGYQQDEDFPPNHQMAPEGAINIVGMGLWRLQELMNDIFSTLVANIEGSWRQIVGLGDLRIYPIDLKWKIMDSLDPEFKLKGEGYYQIPFPSVDKDAFPRMLVESRFYTTVTFRKLHIQITYRQDGIRNLHIMMYPRPCHELPIFYLNVEEINERVIHMAADFIPVLNDRLLPVEYSEMMKVLLNQNRLRPTEREELPEWAQDIFSDLCLSFKPTCPFDVHAFVRYVIAMMKVHMVMANCAPYLEEAVGEGGDVEARSTEIQENNKRICERLKNADIKFLLESSFSSETVQEYVNDAMFDFHEDGEAWQLDRIRAYLNAWSQTELGISQQDIEQEEQQQEDDILREAQE